MIGLREGEFYDWGDDSGPPISTAGKYPKVIGSGPMKGNSGLLGQHPDEGYKVLAYKMMDDKVVAVRPTTTYRVLSRAGLLRPWERKQSCKGTGFDQPSKPHEHWHIDISYLNILWTFYYLCSVLDGYSLYIAHWELRETMTEKDIEIILERAIAYTGRAADRLISDNGPQFIAKDFKSYLRLKGMKHVRTSPYDPPFDRRQVRGAHERHALARLTGKTPWFLLLFVYNEKTYEIWAKSVNEDVVRWP